MTCMALCNAVWFQRESGSRFVVSLIVMLCRLPAEMMFGGLPLKEPAAYGGRAAQGERRKPEGRLQLTSFSLNAIISAGIEYENIHL